MTQTAPRVLLMLCCALAPMALAAQPAPSEQQLAARKDYDALVKTAQDALAQLSAPEGALFRTLREAEEEMLRLEGVSKAVDESDVKKSRVYERLGDVDRLDVELRWATERFQVKVDEYDHLSGPVFNAFIAYEARALEALATLEQARDKFAAFRGSGAESIESPALTEAGLGRLRDDIRAVLSERKGARDAAPGTQCVLGWGGRLGRIQREIDVREDLRDHLERELEALKQRLSGEGGSEAEPKKEEEKTAAPEGAEEYQLLAARIARLEAEAADAADRARRLETERDATRKLVEAKLATERTVQEQVNQTRAEAEKLKAAQPMPEFHVFALGERADAQEERLNAARLDTRREQTRLEILDRRLAALTARINAIQDAELPAARDQYWQSWAGTAARRAGRVAAVVVIAWLLLFLIKRIGGRALERIIRKAENREGEDAYHRQRSRTLFTVFLTSARLIVWVLAIMFALSQFDIDYGPLLVAAGGVSLALGFGAQSLVKDFFAGFFILLEGQYSIGDVVEISGKTGTVENLNLRTTVIRSLDGSVHTIPNGEIRFTSNMTKLWSRAVLDIGVAYEENTDDVMALLEAVGREMRQDEVWGAKLQEVVMLGVEALGDNSVNIRVLLKTRAGEQWGAAREYRRRVKQKFDEFGVEIPWPQRVVSQKTEPTEHMARRERAKLLRYVRTMRGEKVDEAEAAVSIEERDRAETLARESARMQQQEGEPKPADEKGQAPFSPESK